MRVSVAKQAAVVEQSSDPAHMFDTEQTSIPVQPSASMPPRISFDDISMEYKTDKGSTLALSHLSIEVNPGEPIAIIGPSGCGKSTLLHMAAGLVEPTSGSVRRNDEQVAGPCRTTAFIPQNLGLFPWKTVYQNAALGLKIRRLPKEEVRDRAQAALREVGLEGFEHAYPRDLSGGMRQRLALARAIALDMDLLLMDEPLSAIDALLRESLQDTLLDLWKRRGQTQILVTHSIEEAVYLGRRIVVLSARPGSLIGVVDNPCMGEPEWRDSVGFTEQCKTVRALLNKGAAHADGGATA